VLSIQHHAEPEVLPLRDDQLGLVAGDTGGDRLPAAAGGGDRLEREPAPVADLDRVATLLCGEHVQNPALEEGRVHAELQGHVPAEPAAQVVDHLAQERDGLFGVVHVAGAVLQPEDVAGLGHVGNQGIVARVLPVMRGEAAEGPSRRWLPSG
jgi:hypothetical protein